jgi:hypothetical protein
MSVGVALLGLSFVTLYVMVTGWIDPTSGGEP